MKNNSSPQPHIGRRWVAEDEQEEAAEEKPMKTQKRLCDFCGERSALLYCTPDSAKLCFSCDREVHSTNQLFTKHTRSFLCDACDSSPASIICTTENLVLCQNCDWEKHNRSVSLIHERRPLEGFSGCPSATELLTIAGFDDDLGDKALLLSEDDGLFASGLYGSAGVVDVWSDYLVWDTPSFVTLDDLTVPADSDHNFQAIGVPPLPKNRKAACGQHKDKFLCQLQELSKSEPALNYGTGGDNKLLNAIDTTAPKQNLQQGNAYAGSEHDAKPIDHPAYGPSVNQRVPCPVLNNSLIEEGCNIARREHSVIDGKLSHESGSCEGQRQELNPTTLDASPSPVVRKVIPHEINTQERETAISRYKEKRKTRRYEKHIRYESRKVRAEGRIRIKGRFAKADH